MTAFVIAPSTTRLMITSCPSANDALFLVTFSYTMIQLFNDRSLPPVPLRISVETSLSYNCPSTILLQFCVTQSLSALVQSLNKDENTQNSIQTRALETTKANPNTTLRNNYSRCERDALYLHGIFTCCLLLYRNHMK